MLELELAGADHCAPKFLARLSPLNREFPVGARHWAMERWAHL